MNFKITKGIFHSLNHTTEEQLEEMCGDEQVAYVALPKKLVSYIIDSVGAERLTEYMIYRIKDAIKKSMRGHALISEAAKPHKRGGAGSGNGFRYITTEQRRANAAKAREALAKNREKRKENGQSLRPVKIHITDAIYRKYIGYGTTKEVRDKVLLSVVVEQIAKPFEIAQIAKELEAKYANYRRPHVVRLPMSVYDAAFKTAKDVEVPLTYFIMACIENNRFKDLGVV